jgi:Raf kinase inhibitor-like YbhB/YbcL family protein
VSAMLRSMRRVAAVLVVGAVVAADLQAQGGRGADTTGRGGAARGGGGGGGGGQRGGGGGRGRGGLTVLTMTSTAFKDGGVLPAKYSQVQDVSPPLAWNGWPGDSVVKSFVLLVHNMEGTATVGEGQLHWLVWNIPGKARSLPEGFPQGPEQPDGTRQISQSGPYYRGPAAPSTGPPHHYLFELFALDTVLTVPSVNVAVAPTRSAVLEALAGRVRGKAMMIATFRRDPP